MSWTSFVLTLVLGLLTSRSSAVEDWADWLQPVGGILRIYGADDLLEDPPRRHPPLSFVEETGTDSVQPVNDVHTVPVHSFRQDAVVAAAGAGVNAWSGKTGAAIKFAGATSAAANKVATKVATSNALHVAAANEAATKQDTSGKVLTVANAKEKNPVAALGWFAWIRLSMSLGFIVKSACMACNIFYQASPMPLINEYTAKGDTGDADLAPFIATAYGGWQWCFYGTFAYLVTGKSGFLVLVYSNVVGATLGLYYVYSFVKNCNNKLMKEKSTTYYYILASLVSVQFIAICEMQPVKALFFCGLISSAWSTIASASLVATVPKVYETRNSKSLPLPLVVVGFFSAFLWILCGVMLWDPWITFPNMFACMVCIFALHLCYIFPAHEEGENDCLCEKEAGADGIEDYETFSARDVERASPGMVQRALGLVGRSSGDLKDPGACGTGGTGDSY